MKPRKVKYSESGLIKTANPDRIKDGWFHQFGQYGNEEGDACIQAIIETVGGHVLELPPDWIMFLDIPNT